MNLRCCLHHARQPGHPRMAREDPGRIRGWPQTGGFPSAFPPKHLARASSCQLSLRAQEICFGVGAGCHALNQQQPYCVPMQSILRKRRRASPVGTLPGKHHFVQRFRGRAENVVCDVSLLGFGEKVVYKVSDVRNSYGRS